MSNGTEAVLAELDAILADANEALDHIAGPGGLPYPALLATMTRVLAAVDRLTPDPSPYRRKANEGARQRHLGDSGLGQVVAIVEAFREDVAAGYVRSLEGKVREEVFDDLLDMATHIQSSLHPAPAVVLAGSVLEEHVRKLAAKHGIDLFDAKNRPVAFEQLGHALVKVDEISEPQRKVLSGYYGQRTEAAHGRFESVIADDVPRIIDGIRDFLVRHPA